MHRTDHLRDDNDAAGYHIHTLPYIQMANRLTHILPRLYPQLAAAEEALAASQSEVHELRSQLAAARSQLDDVQEEAAVASQQATLYRQQLDSALAQATQLATQLREVTAEQKQAKGDAMQALSQLGPLQEQLARSDAQLGRLVTAVRGLLSAAAAHDSAASLAQVMAAGLFSSHWQQQDQDVVGSHRPSSASGGAGAAPASVAVLSSSCSSISGAARLLEELLGVMGQEMAKRAAVAQEASREAEVLAGQLRERDEALQLLTAKLK